MQNDQLFLPPSPPSLHSRRAEAMGSRPGRAPVGGAGPARSRQPCCQQGCPLSASPVMAPSAPPPLAPGSLRLDTAVDLDWSPLRCRNTLPHTGAQSDRNFFWGLKSSVKVSARPDPSEHSRGCPSCLSQLLVAPGVLGLCPHQASRSSVLTPLSPLCLLPL